MNKDLIKKIGSVFEVVIVVIVVIFCAFALLQKTILKDDGVFGYRSYVIVSDSMSPELEIGDVILVRNTELADIKVGDVLTYEGMVSDFAGKIITHRVKSIAIEDGEYIFYCQGVNNTLSDPAVYQSQVVGVMAHKFIILSFFSRLIRNGFAFVLVILVPLGFLLVYEMKNMGKEIKSDVKQGKKEKKKKKDREEKLKEIEERKNKLLSSIVTPADEIKVEEPKVKIVPKVKEEVKKEEIVTNDYDEDYLEVTDETNILDEFKKENLKKINNVELEVPIKNKVKEPKVKKEEKIEESSIEVNSIDDIVIDKEISEEDILESTGELVIPIKISDGLQKKKSLSPKQEISQLKRKARGIDTEEIDITSDIDASYGGYDITSDIEDALEKTKEFSLNDLTNVSIAKKTSKNSTKNKNDNKSKKNANLDLPKLK